MILTIGGTTKDIIFKTQGGQVISNPADPLKERLLAFEYGAKVKINEMFCGFGGGASNTAIGLKRLGFKTKPMVCVGSDKEGQEIKKNFRKERVASAAVQTDKKNITGSSLIVIAGGENDHTAFLYRGANSFLKIKEKDFKQVECLYLSSLDGADLEERMEKILKNALRNKIKIFFNPGADQLKLDKQILAKFLEQTTVLILNLDEARELALRFGLAENKLEYAFIFRTLKDLGPQVVAITDGKHGARAYDGKKEHHCPVSFPRPRVADSTGAGDAFSAGFLAGFMKNSEMVARALKWGVINAESVLGCLGAQQGLLTKKQMEDKLEN